MKYLIVVRHAPAGKRDAKQWPNDADRPLTRKGEKQFAKAARGLSYVVGAPRELLTSPFVRTVQTARILVKAAEYPKAEELDELRPHCSTGSLIQALRRRKTDRLAIVGHEPNLSKLVAKLLPGSAKSAAFELDKGSVTVIQFDGPIVAGRGQLVACVPSRWLEAMR